MTAPRSTNAPLLAPPSAAGDARAQTIAALVLVVAITLTAFAPTLQNGFLEVGFDDAIVTDTPALQRLGWNETLSLFTEFNHAHYAPLTFLSLALDHALWGGDPFGFHLGNVLLQALVAVLVWLFLRPLMPSLWSTTLAALVFAVHPLQLEAVTLVIQRKTLLSGAGFFLTLICYRHWRAAGGWAWYAAAVAVFAAAALAKPIVATLPLVLWLYEYTFVDGRLRWLDKLPFLVIAAATTAAAAAAHAAVGIALTAPDAGLAARAAVMGRVSFEYLAAVLLPIDLAPTYYYRRALVFEPLNLVALAGLVALVAFVVVRRRRFPWTFFASAWFALTLLPESNLFPLVQLRADRFLYLPMVGAGVWIAIVVERCGQRLGARGTLVAQLASAAAVLAMVRQTRASAGVWRSDITARARVVERQPWAANAWLLLAHSRDVGGEQTGAAEAYAEALRLDPNLASAHLGLARLRWQSGNRADAEAHARRYLELEPGGEEGLALLAEMQRSTDE